jgi:hypothetical protein
MRSRLVVCSIVAFGWTSLGADSTLGEGAILISYAGTRDAAIADTPAPVAYLSDDFFCDAADETTCECPCTCGDAVGCGDACGSGKVGAAAVDPCTLSHKGVYYVNDFSYLNDPGYDGQCLGDCLKLMPVCGDGRGSTLDIGGQMRLRYHHEIGMGQEAGLTRFQDTENDFMLSRLRLYTNWKVCDWCRFYCEGIFADALAESDYIPRDIERNYGDYLNCFVDVAAADCMTLRVGRQELLYGAQRTVSPLDWANTRRTFEGVKLMFTEGDWVVDAFYTFFVPPVADALDEPDYKQRFYGVYGVYTGNESCTMDVYYLGYDDTRPLSTQPVSTRDFSLHTCGTRFFGTFVDGMLYEIEGAYQFGRQSGLGLDHSAGFCTCGLGRQLSDAGWKPTVWVYYDYASGDHIGGDFTRYNHLFPLGHKYLGFIDATQRSNIECPNLLLTMAPSAKLSLLCWYYYFMSASDTDIVPSIGGTPAQSPDSKDWGQELDCIVQYRFNPRSNILFGWSHFWTGNKITPPGGAVDADFFYTQWELDF